MHFKFEDVAYDFTIENVLAFPQCYAAVADRLGSMKGEYCMPNQVKHIREKVIELEKQGISMFDYHLPINGNDVMETLGIPPSSEVKDCLKWAMKFAYNNPNITREKLLKQIKQWKT